MTQEDINEVQWNSLPQWWKDQLVEQDTIDDRQVRAITPQPENEK